MTQKRFTVTLDSDADPDGIADELRSKGYKVSNVMKEIGLISASTDEDDLESVRSLQGVSAVEEEGGFQIAPPESPIQ